MPLVVRSFGRTVRASMVPSHRDTERMEIVVAHSTAALRVLREVYLIYVYIRMREINQIMVAMTATMTPCVCVCLWVRKRREGVGRNDASEIMRKATSARQRFFSLVPFTEPGRPAAIEVNLAGGAREMERGSVAAKGRSMRRDMLSDYNIEWLLPEMLWRGVPDRSPGPMRRRTFADSFAGMDSQRIGRRYERTFRNCGMASMNAFVEYVFFCVGFPTDAIACQEAPECRSGAVDYFTFGIAQLWFFVYFFLLIFIPQPTVAGMRCWGRINWLKYGFDLSTDAAR